MAALFMDLLVDLTCECLIIFKTMLFVCAWVLTEFPPLPIYAWKKLSLQCCLKLSCNYNNPAYATGFNSTFHPVFERKPTQLPPLAIRVSGDLQVVGFKKSDVITSSIPTTPPWLLTRPAVNFTLHCSDKSNTPPEIFKHRFHELCHEFKNYYCIFTDGSREGNRVAAAVVHRDNTKCVRLLDTASTFRAVGLPGVNCGEVSGSANSTHFIVVNLHTFKVSLTMMRV